MRLVDDVSLADIPGQLRKLADAIEGGDRGTVLAAITVLWINGPKWEVLGHGKADSMTATAILAQGLHKLLAMNS